MILTSTMKIIIILSIESVHVVKDQMFRAYHIANSKCVRSLDTYNLFWTRSIFSLLCQ